MNDLNNFERVSRTLILVTMNVNSLYSNLPREEGISAVRNFLRQFPSPYTDSDTIIQLLELKLNYNVFSFDNSVYPPIQGGPMGSKYLPATRIFSWVPSKKYLSTRIPSNL